MDGAITLIHGAPTGWAAACSFISNQATDYLQQSEQISSKILQLDINLLQYLTAMLYEVNTYVQSIRYLREKEILADTVTSFRC